ncbi:MAG: lysylphosphatidylglycerol synthase transmembrane domain-containing protein [Actinomycetota bacterium]
MIRRALMVLGIGVALYLLIPRLGGLSRDAAALRHAHVSLMLLGVVAETAAIAAYITLYHGLLRAEHAEVSWHTAERGVMSAFLVSHILPGGSAAGTVMYVRTLEREGIPARRTGLAIGLAVLMSDMALALIFLVGIIYSLVKQNVPVGYVAAATVVIPVLAALVALAFVLAFHRDLGARIVRGVARVLHKVIHKIDPDALATAAGELAAEARAALTGRRFLMAVGLALANWLLDILVLYWFFLAVGHHQHFGALLVAYALANIAAAIPLTPAGLGFVEATLIAVSVAFGAPRHIAVVAVLGYRLVNFWLPLPVGLAAYIHSRAMTNAPDA